MIQWNNESFNVRMTTIVNGKTIIDDHDEWTMTFWQVESYSSKQMINIKYNKLMITNSIEKLSKTVKFELKLFNE